MNLKKLFAFLASFGALSGCSEMRQTFGLDKKSPDEFAVEVYDRAPLTLPPDFELRPPVEGNSLKVPPSKQEAQSLLHASPSQAALPLSQGESDLLEKVSSRDEIDPTLRAQVNQEARAEKEIGDVPSATRFSWQKAKVGHVINPVEEKKRLEKKSAQRK